PLQGRIRTAGRGIDPQTHLVPVLVEVPADARLQLGDAVDARIELAPFDAWAVPRAAVLQDDKGAYLFVVRDGKARRIPVTVRQPEGDTLGVDAALPARAAVIVDGAYEAEDGMPVREGQR
ncbi:MAG: efflux transporter periplasmic adaptor subunit, partial [Xanthomonadaceae bacterium]|nr:efflux transporter periplasmic adaptor subunit [Xanthomonadaceae bacterium]